MLVYGMRPQWDEAFFAERRAALEQWCDRLLAEPCAQPGEVRVRNRLAKQRPHLLGCLYEPAAQPTNNRAERELRPAVIARKLSCGNNTPAGRHCWEVLASIARTCSQRAEDFVNFLAARLPPACRCQRKHAKHVLRVSGPTQFQEARRDRTGRHWCQCRLGRRSP